MPPFFSSRKYIVLSSVKQKLQMSDNRLPASEGLRIPLYFSYVRTSMEVSYTKARQNLTRFGEDLTSTLYRCTENPPHYPGKIPDFEI